MSVKAGRDLRSRIVELAEEAIDTSDLFLVDVLVRGRVGSTVVEVFVDGDDAVGLDELASISRNLGFALETEDIISGKYNLNVSSPGAERALTMPRQYAKHVGREIKVKLSAEGDELESDTIAGELISNSDADIRILVQNGTERTIKLKEIKQARILLPW